LSSNAATERRREPVALLRGPCGLGKTRTISRGALSGSCVTKVARLLGSSPPKIRAMPNSEWLPQTMPTSCGLSLMTSHSAHNTAFCSGRFAPVETITWDHSRERNSLASRMSCSCPVASLFRMRSLLDMTATWISPSMNPSIRRSQASSKVTPSMCCRMSIRAGGWPIWKVVPIRKVSRS
jgi:hypothetical protein